MGIGEETVARLGTAGLFHAQGVSAAMGGRKLEVDQISISTLFPKELLT
jgi:hypothetical protein